MPLLFSYGTLREQRVQLATFGRTLRGVDDTLVGYRRSQLRIEDPAVAARLGRTHHDNVTRTGDDASVSGRLLELTEDELARADQYEAEFEYRRVLVRLKSGREGWVYVHDRSSP
jgi:gamma-glutamylcyclotransferase (GGCT)/AIG2-like uncharacterized protein YtfP